MIDFKLEIAKEISDVCNIDVNEIYLNIEIPPTKDKGDFAFPCFKLAKVLKKSPVDIANDIILKINLNKDYFENIKNESGYLNFYLNKYFLTKCVLEEINEKDKDYGKESHQEQTILVEYSSPNIAKNFHIGHLRNTIIGNTFYKIYKFLGYNTIGINHLGDYGTQFGKLIEGYKRWGDEYDLSENPIEELTKLYVRVNKLCKEDDEVLKSARQNFKDLEDGDEYAVNLWNKFKDLSLKEFQKIYDLLGVKFDSIKGESFYVDKTKDIEDILDESGLVSISDGAKIIDLSSLNLGVCILRKSDGSSIYATRDLAAIKYRADTYNFDKCLYVVSSDQALYFKQIFEIAKYLKLPKKCTDGLKHIQYGLTTFNGKKMSTREGNVVDVNSLLNESISRVKDIINKKNPGMEDLDDNAKKIGIGAIKFNALSNSLIKDQNFDWDLALNFQGETGPYIQYTYIRTKSVLDKFESLPSFKDVDISLLLDDKSQKVIYDLYNFNSVLNKCINNYETCFLTRYLIDLAEDYTEFYNSNKILVDDKNLKEARGYLTLATKNVIEIGSNLLGIDMPTEM